MKKLFITILMVSAAILCFGATYPLRSMVFRHWFPVKTANQQHDSHQARKSVRHA